MDDHPERRAASTDLDAILPVWLHRIGVDFEPLRVVGRNEKDDACREEEAEDAKQCDESKK